MGSEMCIRDRIYRNEKVNQAYESSVRPMFRELYEKLLYDLKRGEEGSPVYRHHVNYVQRQLRYYQDYDYLQEEPNQIVTDYIASMTDDYFVALHRFLFPESRYRIEYKSYFEDLKER